MKEYIGDSVYVEIERGMLKLTTENDGTASNTIFLEPDVYQQLTRYARRFKVDSLAGFVVKE